MPLLIAQVPKQLCPHPESHQVAPLTPRVPPPPPWGLGNLEESGYQQGPLCLPGFPSPATKKTSMLFQLQSKNSQILICLRERDREGYRHQQPTEDTPVYLAEVCQGGLSSAGEDFKQGLWRVKRNIVVAFIASCLTSRWCSSNVLKQGALPGRWPRGRQPLQGERGVGGGSSAPFPLCSCLSSLSPFFFPLPSFLPAPPPCSSTSLLIPLSPQYHLWTEHFSTSCWQ